MSKMDEELNLEQLLARCKEMNQDECINIYFDPDTRYFYINPIGVMPFWLPRNAYHVSRCLPSEVRSIIEGVLSYAVYKLTKEEKT